MTNPRTRSSNKRASKTGDAATGSCLKRRKLVIDDVDISSHGSQDFSHDLRQSPPVHATPGASQMLSKPILKERLVDTALLE